MSEIPPLWYLSQTKADKIDESRRRKTQNLMQKLAQINNENSTNNQNDRMVQISTADGILTVKPSAGPQQPTTGTSPHSLDPAPVNCMPPPLQTSVKRARKRSSDDRNNNARPDDTSNIKISKIDASQTKRLMESVEMISESSESQEESDCSQSDEGAPSAAPPEAGGAPKFIVRSLGHIKNGQSDTGPQYSNLIQILRVNDSIAEPVVLSQNLYIKQEMEEVAGPPPLRPLTPPRPTSDLLQRVADLQQTFTDSRELYNQLVQSLKCDDELSSVPNSEHSPEEARRMKRALRSVLRQLARLRGGDQGARRQYRQMIELLRSEPSSSMQFQEPSQETTDEEMEDDSQSASTESDQPGESPVYETQFRTSSPIYESRTPIYETTITKTPGNEYIIPIYESRMPVFETNSRSISPIFPPPIYESRPPIFESVTPIPKSIIPIYESRAPIFESRTPILKSRTAMSRNAIYESKTPSYEPRIQSRSPIFEARSKNKRLYLKPILEPLTKAAETEKAQCSEIKIKCKNSSFEGKGKSKTPERTLSDNIVFESNDSVANSSLDLRIKSSCISGVDVRSSSVVGSKSERPPLASSTAKLASASMPPLTSIKPLTENSQWKIHDTRRRYGKLIKILKAGIPLTESALSLTPEPSTSPSDQERTRTQNSTQYRIKTEHEEVNCNPIQYETAEPKKFAKNERSNLLQKIYHLDMDNKIMQDKLMDAESKINSLNGTVSSLQRDVTILNENCATETALREKMQEALCSVFTECQVEMLLKKRKQPWTWDQETLSRALAIRMMSNNQMYIYLKDQIKFPLPGISTLAAFSKKDL